MAGNGRKEMDRGGQGQGSVDRAKVALTFVRWGSRIRRLFAGRRGARVGLGRELKGRGANGQRTSFEADGVSGRRLAGNLF
jgi:hypothetical protein